MTLLLVSYGLGPPIKNPGYAYATITASGCLASMRMVKLFLGHNVREQFKNKPWSPQATTGVLSKHKYQSLQFRFRIIQTSKQLFL